MLDTGWRRHAELSTDLPHKYLVNRRMPRHRRLFAGRRLPPNRVSASFSKQLATVRTQMLEERLPLHAGISTSSNSPDRSRRACCRLSSRISCRASAREDISSSRLDSCALTPGISSIQPIHQPSSCWITAVNCRFMVGISVRVAWEQARDLEILGI